VIDERDLEPEIEREPGRHGPRRAGRDHRVDATLVALVGVADAVPALVRLCLYLETTAHVPAAERATQRDACRVAIARLVALVVRVDHLLREREAGHA